MTIGERIKELRERLGMSQVDFQRTDHPETEGSDNCGPLPAAEYRESGHTAPCKAQ